ncbi:hypothetical protein [Chondromyces crocatus]|uniref:GYF domain-containing protein n=1 Tax=Chondromyces crocatus TaxID=52 RepID=A0A0K1EII2_CHOCO|nr:hypothetical protein [Chondromyces crocatus]AKT40665.1 uncharacterized protein CMC5_048210 [Chondromyces crocatus]
MPTSVELYVLDEGRGYGPLSIEKVRSAISEGTIGVSARFRVSEGHPWLPGAAWDPVADLLPAPHLPEPPEGSPAPLPPGEVAGLPAHVRELLRWFVSDEDGVMGPVGGDFLVKAIKAGKLSTSAAIALAARRIRAEWTVAAVVFPGASAGATTVRRRGAPAAPCAYCKESLTPAASTCPACGEPTRLSPGPTRREQVFSGAAALGVVTVLSLVLAPFLQRDRALQTPLPAAAPSASAPSSAPPPDVPPTPSRPSPAHLTTLEVAATLTAPPNATDVLAIAPDRLAVASSAALQIVDLRGAHRVTLPELSRAQALFPVHGSELMLVVLPERPSDADPAPSGKRVAPRLLTPLASPATPRLRLATVHVPTARPLAVHELTWSALPPIAIASARGLAFLPDPSGRTLLRLAHDRLDSVYRPALEAPMTLLTLDATGEHALAAEGPLILASPAPPSSPSATSRPRPAPPASRPEPHPAALVAFHATTEREPDARPTHRIQLAERPSAIALAPNGAFGVALLLARRELVRFDLGSRASLGPVGPHARTCDDAIDLALGRDLLLVACRSTGLTLLDATTLTPVAQLDLGAPILQLALAPDRTQALVLLDAPSPGVTALDLSTRTLTPLVRGEPLQRLRYGLGGHLATAFAPSTRRIVVLR